MCYLRARIVERPSTVSEKWESKGSCVLSSNCCRSLTRTQQRQQTGKYQLNHIQILDFCIQIINLMNFILKRNIYFVPPKKKKNLAIQQCVCDFPPTNPSDSPGSHPEVFLNKVAGDSQRQKGNEENGCDVGDDTQSRHAQQGGAGEALEGGGNVLIDCVGVSGKSVQDAAERSGLKEPEEKKESKIPWTLSSK